MGRVHVIGMVLLIFAGMPSPAFAQTDQLIGNWSGSSSGPEGTRRFAMSLEFNETFVSVLTLPSGMTQRVWGGYRAVRVGPDEVKIAFTPKDWLPYKTCVKGLGRIPRCTPYKPVLPSPVTMKFELPLSPKASPRSFKIDGVTWNRELNTPILMSQIVPDHQMLASPVVSSPIGQPTYRKYTIPP